MSGRHRRLLTLAEMQEIAHRQQRQQERADIREARHGEYRRNGLNGGRAVLRRQLQQARIDAKVFKNRIQAAKAHAEGGSHG